LIDSFIHWYKTNDTDPSVLSYFVQLSQLSTLLHNNKTYMYHVTEVKLCIHVGYLHDVS